MMELPPRTRRILRGGEPEARAHGTTSAYAENTRTPFHPLARRRNYLRVCGEYLIDNQFRFVHIGTTSAYAENTGRRGLPLPVSRNYLRVRGEYSSDVIAMMTNSELPPRMRRIPTKRRNPEPGVGTTSAYAENTLGRRFRRCRSRNYLRVCGEYGGG